MNALHPLAAFLDTLRPTYTRCKIVALDGRRIAFASFTDPLAVWPWAQETIAEEFECQVDDVTCLETDDGDAVAVRGELVARFAWGANARLIAAAPDMLAALQMAADTIHSYHGDQTSHDGWQNEEVRDVWLAARAAIAKATQP